MLGQEYGSIPNAVYQQMPKSIPKRQHLYLVVVLGLTLVLLSYKVHVSHSVNVAQMTSSGAERKLFGAHPEELGIKAEWFDPSKHFFTQKRLLESGLSLQGDAIPDEFDWTDHMDFIIKDQGHASTCWSFGSTEMAEAAHWTAGNDMPRLSEQQLLDCLGTVEGDEGTWCLDDDCEYLGWDKGDGGNGGWAEDAMQFWSKHGFVDAIAYPYNYGVCKNRQNLPPNVEYTFENLKANCEAFEGCRWAAEQVGNLTPEDFYQHLGRQMCQNMKPKVGTCRKDVEPSGTISGIVLVSYDPRIKAMRTSGINEEAMKEALVKLGPLSIQANAAPMMGYRTGILDLEASECDPTDLDHVLQLVGYGTEDGVDYWKIRNSWGPFWGEKGYVRVKRGTNVCGVAANVFGAYA